MTFYNKMESLKNKKKMLGYVINHNPTFSLKHDFKLKIKKLNVISTY